jgi:hypothetical protein
MINIDMTVPDGGAGGGMTMSPPPDYLKHESFGDSLVAAAVSTTVISSVLVGLRFITRAGIVHAVGRSDWVILAALLFSIAHSAGTIEQVRMGSLGRHAWTVSPEVAARGLQVSGPKVKLMNASLTPNHKVAYFTILAYIVSLVLIKISILLLYLRILGTVFLHRAVHAAFAIVIILGLYSLITNILVCVPIEAAWNPVSHPDAWCWPSEARWWPNITIHLFTELMILVIPMPFLFSLNIPWKRRVGVILLFALGFL